MITQDIQKFFARGDTWVMCISGILKVHNDCNIFDLAWHETNTTLQTKDNMFDLTVSILGILESRTHNPDGTTVLVESIVIHLTRFSLIIQFHRKESEKRNYDIHKRHRYALANSHISPRYTTEIGFAISTSGLI